MEASLLVDQLSQAETKEDAKRILSPFKGLPGLSAAYFQKVASLLGADPAAAVQLARHWQEVRRYGDEPAFAYRAKAGGERAQGQWLKSARSFFMAGAAATTPIDKLSFQRAAVDSLARANRFEEAVKLGRRLVRGLEALGERTAAAQTRLNLANALLWQDRYRLAMKQYQLAIEPLEEAGQEVEATSAKLGLSTANLLGGDLSQAERYAAEARDEYAELGLQHYADLATINLAQKALLTGRADTALDLLLDVRSRFVDGSPTDEARVNEFLGDAYYRLNLWQEAVDSFEAALAVEGEVPLLNRGNCHFGIGLALLAMGQVSDAKQRFAKAKSLFQRANNRVWSGVAQSHLGKANLTAGAKARAVRHISEGEALLEGTHAWFRLAECRLDLAEALLEVGEDPTPALLRASRLVSKHSLTAHTWRPHALRAASSPPGKRLPHYRQMLEGMLEARLLTSSTHSRINFLADKAKYVKLYLHELLSHPTPRRLQECLQVILRTRSVALLEEIVSTAQVPEEAARELEQLREELNALTAAETPTGGTRLHAAGTARAANLQRRWVEATRSIQAAAELSLGQIEPGCVVLVEANGQLFALTGMFAKQLNLTARELEHRLRWLEFDLLSPTAGGPMSQNIENALGDLARELIEPWYEGQESILLSPDGQLWRVPWQACLQQVRPGAEAVIALHPSASSASVDSRLTKQPKAAIWLYEGSDLPHAQREAESFLRIFPSAQVYRSLQETRSALTERFDLLHVAGHARLNPENPMFSYLQFSDGRMHAAEIATSELRADLVTLSACETARMSLSVQDEPEGLTRAFLARGASAVLGSSWALHDEAAARMMEPYYASLAAGGTVGEALQTARNEGRDWNQHPYYWAGLVLFAGYRTRGRS